MIELYGEKRSGRERVNLLAGAQKQKKKKKESSLLRSRSFAVEGKGAVDKHGRSSNTASAVDERKPPKKKNGADCNSDELQ